MSNQTLSLKQCSLQDLQLNLNLNIYVITANEYFTKYQTIQYI